MIKSEYLICYDKATSQKLRDANVKQLNEYATLADREDIKRVIKLRDCNIIKYYLRSLSYKMEIVIKPPKGRSVHILFPTVEEAEMWYVMLNGSRFSINLEDFEVIGELGQGSFGRVELVRYAKDNKCYAMKTVEVKGEGSSFFNQFVEERTVMQKMQACPFIVQLRMAFREANCLYYVMEYCDRGDLLALIRAKHQLSEDELRPLAASLVEAVGYMHHQNVLHRDIKPENILLTDAGVAKLADFGLCKTLSSMRSRAFSFCGTDLYRPPEMSQTAAGYNRALDWWQVGCVIYEMAVGRPPFDGSKEERRKKVLREEPAYPETFSPELLALLRGLLKKNPFERLGGGDLDCLEVKKMGFFDAVDWERLEGLAREEPGGELLGVPSPVRPNNNPPAQVKSDSVMDAELMGFEYDERNMKELYRTLQSFAGSGGCIFGGYL